MSDIIGQVLLNQYRVDAFIAAGGMGAVYRVWDLKRNVPLAMKVLHAELADDPSVFKRFQREGRALQKLAHPNIVPFYGLFQTADFSFMLERFVDGPSLKDILKRQKGAPLALDETLIYLKALCAALGYAHVNGVVHCDVKPGNVIIDRGGNIYLTDFGIARHAESTTTTMGGAGTPAYMPPEQILGQAVSPATDVYALGVILYEMLTGQRPFRGAEAGTEQSGETVNERIRYGHLHVPPKDPRELVSTIPEELAKVVLKTLSKDATGRYASAPQFFDAVCTAVGASSEQIAGQIFVSNPETAPDYSGGNELIAPQIPDEVDRNLFSRRKTSVALVLIGMIILMIAGAIFLFRPGGAANPLPTFTPFPTSTSTPQPTATNLPPTQTAIPSNTPRPANTSAPQSTAPIFTLHSNAFCRMGPGSSYDDVDAFLAGKSFSIIGQNAARWWKVSINIPNSHHKACWFADSTGTVTGDTSSVAFLNE
jgi:serine/threonine-protein kinase